MKPSTKPHLKLIERGTQLERRAWAYSKPDPDYDYMAVYRAIQNQERKAEKYSAPDKKDLALMFGICIIGLVAWTAFILWAVN